MQLSIQNFQLDISWNPQTSCLKLSPWCPATAPPHLLLLLSAQFWLFPQPGHLEPSILFQVATTIHPLEWLNINEKKKKKKDNRKHWYDGKETWNSHVLLIRVKLLQFILKYVFFFGIIYETWCFWTVVLEKTFESPLDCKEIQPVHSEGDQPWDFFGRNDAKVETPVLWPSHAKSWLIGKDCDAGRDWGQEEKGTTVDEMASLTLWTWVWVNSGSRCWTGRPGVVRFMGSQRVRHDWATDLIW